MAEGGSVKHRMEQAKQRTEELNEACRNAGMSQGPRSLYRMNDDEFQHHVSTLTHERILIQKLGISEEEYKLMIQETWNLELQKLLNTWKEFRAGQLREQLTRGIVIRPDIEA